MRIGIDARTAGSTGGIGRYVYDLVRFLGRYGTKHAYTVFIYADQDVTWVPATMKIIKLNRSFKKLLPIIWEHCFLPTRFRAARLDLMHFPHLNVPLGVRGPFVATAHDISIYDHPEWFARGQWLSTAVVVPRAIRRARRILAVSPDVANRVPTRFHINRELVSVIPNGFDDTRFVPVNNPTRDYLLYVGSAAPYKNIAGLNRIVGNSGLPCVVVGLTANDFQKAAGCSVLAANYKFIDWLEYGDDKLVRLYQNAACLLQPSLYESFALPVLEALACGTSVVASDIPSLKTVYGTAIRYAPLDDLAAWQKNIKELQTADRITANSETRQQISQYSWRVLVDRLETLYSTAII